MQTVAFAWRMLVQRPWGFGLNVLLLALGLASAGFVVLAQNQLEAALTNDLAKVDVVVGAKGSPLQLILASVLHVDVPAGNIALSELQTLSKHPMVKQTIPISLGDNVGGFRIVGTTPAYAQLYGGQLREGRAFAEPMEVVLGAEVAASLALQIGSSFTGFHGLGSGGEAHAKAPYSVVGTLQACACVLDKLVLTPTESVWQVHDKELATDEADRAEIAAAMLGQREVTAAIIQYTSPLAAASFPRFVNQKTNLQAAAPAYEISRLLRMLGAGTAVLKGFAATLLLAALLSVWIALLGSLRERRADWATLRMLGASRVKVMGVLFTQSIVMALIAGAFAALLAVGAHWGAAALAQTAGVITATSRGGWFDALQNLSQLWWLPALGVGVAVLATIWPARALYRIDAAELLASRRI